MSSLLRHRLILVLASSIVAVVCSGCNPIAFWTEMKAPEVYIPEGRLVELRGPHKVKVWTHDKQGNPVRGYVMAQDRYLLGPATPAVPAQPEAKPNTTSDDDGRKFAEIK